MKKHVFDCVGFGVCPADYTCMVKKYPGPDEKTVALGSTLQGGGPVGTALSALGRWGVNTAIISAIGADRDGQFVRRDFSTHSVNTLYLRMVKGWRTPRAFIWVQPSSGRRTVALDESESPVPVPGDFLLKDLPACRVFHTDGRYPDAALKLMRHYRKKGAALVMDAGSPRDRMDELIAATDHFVASANFMRKYFGARVKPETACARLVAGGAKTAVITLGEKGCVGIAGGDAFRVTALKKKGFVVDTNGAGDVFHAGYIYGLLKGMPPEECARIGNAAAFLKCGKPGGRAGIPPLAAVKELTKKK